MKFGVCAIIKNENLYLREWVEHYIKLGFDKIILYDNNEINGEIPNVVIQDYIDTGYVDIINWKKTPNNFEEFKRVQINSYNDCLEKYKNELDWIAFFDIDEFLELVYHKKIQYIFDAHKEYNNFNTIIVSWYTIGDENELYYRNEKVQTRFTKHVTGEYAEQDNIDKFVKSFVKTCSGVKFFDHVHCPWSGDVCNVYGVKCGGNEPAILDFPNHDAMYLKHYYTKSLNEYLYKLFKSSNFTVNRSIKIYKNINGWTEEHERVYQKFLKDNNTEASN